MLKLKKLEDFQIRELSQRKGVRRVAVENFLGTLTNNGSPEEAVYNMLLDAGLYRWNQETINAIKRGIELATYE